MSPNKEHEQEETEYSDEVKAGIRLAAAAPGEEVCITGFGGSFPDADNIHEFSNNLFNKYDMVTEENCRWSLVHPDLPTRAGRIHNIQKFDAAFFGFHYKQAQAMDPMWRHLFEKVYEAIVDAGLNPAELKGTRTGVFVGACISESEKTWFYDKLQPHGFGITGCSRALLATRISYWLGLNGPSYVIDSACSSSSYAFENAYKAIRDGHCDQAIVGGANVCLHPNSTLMFSRLGVLSLQGRCKAFDAEGNGYARSEAINALILQKTKDAKRIYATVVHAKTNCDGFKEQGITYPSGKMQKVLFEEFYQECQVNPTSLAWLEAHGTGTKVGDPEELNAIDQVFCKGRSTPLLIGSVKSNMGHSEPVSGLCSIAKVIIAMETERIPPNMHYEAPREGVAALVEGRMKVITEALPWKGGLVGVNSFGFGGANAHMLLQSHTKTKINGGAPLDKIPRLIVTSSRTEQGLKQILDDLESRPVDAEYVRLFHDVHALHIPGHMYRGYTLRKQGEPIRSEKFFENVNRSVWFVFSGLDGQWTGMGKSLLVIPAFAKAIDKCHQALMPLGLDLRRIVTDDKLDSLIHTFVGITAVQIGLVDVLRTVGIHPDGLIGHSIGELAAGYADDCLTIEQTILIAYYRGLAVLETDFIDGSMAEVGFGGDIIGALIPEDIEVACYNGHERCIVSGPTKSIKMLVNSLTSNLYKAKVINSNNIAAHSRYVRSAGPKLKKYLKNVISSPKARSKHWISSSVSKTQRASQLDKLASVDYFANNLSSPVLFEEALKHIPSHATVIEISPNATLQEVLGGLEKHTVYLPLTDRRYDGTEYLLTALGDLYTVGLELKLANLYPAVTYPVSRGTPMISPLIGWDHSSDWYVTTYDSYDTFKTGEREIEIDVRNDDMKYYAGHTIDGRILFPATGYLGLVWDTVALMGDLIVHELPVVFENVIYHRATTVPKDGSVTFTVIVQKSTGNFEVEEGGAAIVTGRVYISEDIASEMITIPPPKRSGGDDVIEQNTRDIYKELRLRGYNYAGLFRSLVSTYESGRTSKIRWHNNWVAFMDILLQMQILTEDTRGLFVPTSFEKMCIDPVQHLALAEAMGDDKVFDAFVYREIGLIRAGGIEIRGLNASAIPRRKPLGDPVIEKYNFIPNTNLNPIEDVSTIQDALRICVHVALENYQDIKVKAVELADSYMNTNKAILAQDLANILGDLPLLQADITVLLTHNNPLTADLGPNIKVDDRKLSLHEDCIFVIGANIFARPDILQTVLGCIGSKGYIITRESRGQAAIKEVGLEVLNEYTVADEKLVLIKKSIAVIKPAVIKINEGNFSWIPILQTALRNETSNQRVLMVAQGEPMNGILGLFNCVRTEPGGNNARCIFILDKSAPAFDPDLPFYKRQISKDLAMNVYSDGQWGSYRHLALKDCAKIDVKHAYCNVTTRGDLSSFQWLEGHINPNTYKAGPEESLVHIYYSALNFRDVMTASGKLAPEVMVKGRIKQDCVQGLEFSGRDSTGKRVMGLVESTAMATMVVADTSLLWDIPDHWSLEDAATVPIVYSTVYTALCMSGRMAKSDTVLIHAGSGGVGQAAIYIALHEGCTVFTTVGTQEKRDFIKRTFPQLTDSHIGNSRDTSFEQMIMTETNGRGVDLVLNSLSEEKLQASVRCLARGGRFLEIGKFDLVKNNTLDMEIFLNETSFHGIMLDSLFGAPREVKMRLNKVIAQGVRDGAIKPLTRNIFPDDQVEEAFRFMAAGKHIGKVLLKVREEEECKGVVIPELIVHKATPRFFCDTELTYIIAGGLGGFGLELADWLVLRGARKIVLTSRSGLKTGYQSSRVRTWRSYGVNIQISTADITTQRGVTSLLKEANQLGPVVAIFNLAVVLQDGLFENQTIEKFVNSFGPKAEATKHFDVISRKLCPQLKHFVIFSSVSCGRGNAGQTNYGMANSVMERICERRVKEGYPGLAVQWGAVGEVGLVADMQEEEHELVIGGTLQQRISSCLKVLDGFLRQPHPVVASMVVAEKRMGTGGSGNIVDCVANILGLKDLKTVSIHMTLAELGMDSMMVVEIKQTLEREFEVFMTPQEVRAVTFARLIELANTQADDKKSTKDNAISEFNALPLLYMLRSLGDEVVSNRPTVVLPSLAVGDRQTTLFMIPGIEGTATVFEPLAKHLLTRVTGLQLGYHNEADTALAMAKFHLPYMKNALLPKAPFALLGYSFGGLVALQLARLLELDGHQGKLFLIDGSPDFLQAIVATQIIDGTEDYVQINIILTALNILKEQDPDAVEKVRSDLSNLTTWEERVEHFLTLAPESHYSLQFRKDVVNSALRRIRSVRSFSWPEGVQLKSSVSLIRPTVKALATMDDYGINKYCDTPVEVQFVTGDHTSILVNSDLPNIINSQVAYLLEKSKLLKKSTHTELAQPIKEIVKIH